VATLQQFFEQQIQQQQQASSIQTNVQKVSFDGSALSSIYLFFSS
jgi:hypothetical protein